MIPGTGQMNPALRTKKGLEMGTWDLTTANLLSDTLGSRYGPRGINFNEDGTILVFNSGLKIEKHILSTAWDLSVASYHSEWSNFPSSGLYGPYFSPDGTRMYLPFDGDDTLYEYRLSTAWDLGSISLVNSRSLSAQSASVRGVSFNPEGTRMYYLNGAFIYQYSLATPWDISTMNYDNISKNTYGSGYHRAFYMSVDGKYVMFSHIYDKQIERSSMSTPWDLSTLTEDNNTLSLPSSSYGLTFKPDGRKLFLGIYSGTGLIQQYTLD